MYVYTTPPATRVRACTTSIMYSRSRSESSKPSIPWQGQREKHIHAPCNSRSSSETCNHRHTKYSTSTAMYKTNSNAMHITIDYCTLNKYHNRQKKINTASKYYHCCSWCGHAQCSDSWKLENKITSFWCNAVSLVLNDFLQSPVLKTAHEELRRTCIHKLTM